MIVPSEYQSKSRCEMKEINKHREEEQAVRAKENERIRERIKAEGSSLERRKEEYKHRICSKCRPAE